MSRIRSKNTKPELVVRMVLHRLGYRFSLRRKDLPGTPDIVLAKHKAVIFVHGCFWHRHARCRLATKPKSRAAYWRAKFERNVKRDARVRRALRKLGWKVLAVWECQVMKQPMKIAEKLDKLLRPAAKAKHKSSVTYDLPTKAVLLKAAEKRAEYNVRP